MRNSSDRGDRARWSIFCRCASAVGLLSLLRNERGSVGTSLARVVAERLLQFHSLRLNEYLDLFNVAAHSFLAQARARFQTTDPALSQQQAWQALANLRQQQASALAYFDVFWLLALVMIALLPMVLLMRRSVAEKGARIGGERTDKFSASSGTLARDLLCQADRDDRSICAWPH